MFTILRIPYLSHKNGGVLPSGKRLHNYGKIHHFLAGQSSTISMAIFNSKLLVITRGQHQPIPPASVPPQPPEVGGSPGSGRSGARITTRGTACVFRDQLKGVEKPYSNGWVEIQQKPGKLKQKALEHGYLQLIQIFSYKMVDLSIVFCKRLPEGKLRISEIF